MNARALIASMVVGLAVPATAQAGHTVLPNNTLRVDFAPTDFSILNTGAIGGTRGFAIRHASPGGTGVGMGLGLSYGFTGRAEAGVLFLPLDLSGDGYGDITTHARYRLLFGTFELAVQAALRIPTDTTFGVGLGAPIVLHLDSLEIQTGAELELTFDPTVANLDVPVAILFKISRLVYVGVRTGVFVPSFDNLDLPLGVLAGASIFASNSISLEPIATFMFPRFVTTGADGPLELAEWILQVGVALHFKL